MAHEKTAKVVSSQERIRKLLMRVDTECKKKRYTPTAIVKFVIGIGFLIFIIILLTFFLTVLVSAIAIYSSTLSAEARNSYLMSQIAALAALSLSTITIVISIPLELKESSAEELANWYYGRLVKKLENKHDKPYLKALIKMKCNEFDISLLEIYDNPENRFLFENEALLKKLYESPTKI